MDTFENNEKKIFGETLREIRIKKGLSQESLAEKASLDRTYISSCERGKRNISLINICVIARALEINPSILLKGLDIYDT